MTSMTDEKQASQKADADPKTDAPLPLEPTRDDSVTSASVANGVRLVKVDSIKTAPLFADLLPRTPKAVEEIASSMKECGYDPAAPVVVWASCNTLVDGHTRLEAARRAGLGEIPAVFRDFESEDEAFEYAVHAQCRRRNLTGKEIVRLVEQLDRRHARGGDRRSGAAQIKPPAGGIESSAEKTARQLGVSPRTVERVRQVLGSGDNELVDDVKAGKKSLPQAAAEVSRAAARKRAKRPDADTKNRQQDLKDGLEHLGLAREKVRAHAPGIAEQIDAVAVALDDEINHQ